MSAPSNIEIREAVHADLPSVVRMLADDELGRTREDYRIPLPESYNKAFEEISKSDENALLVAVSEGKVVGVLQVTFIPSLTFTGGRRALLEGFRVDKAFRSMGIGRMMLEEAKKRSAKKACHLIQLTTDKSRPEAKKFYEAFGFEATHEGMKLRLNREEP